MLLEAIKILFPSAINGKDFVLQDDGTGVYIKEWNLPDLKPTQAQIDSVKALAETNYTNNKLRDLRKREYPDIGDQLDAIWKQLAAMQIKGTILVSDADDILLEINTIKTKYPL